MTSLTVEAFQEAVTRVLEALEQQGKNPRNFEPWWRLLTHCYPHVNHNNGRVSH